MLSIVLPAFNEGSTIATIVAASRSVAGRDGEVLVVDDGSVDGTASNAERAGARVLRMHRNRGKGIAVRAGLDAARGDLIALLDADGQDDPAEISTLMAAMHDDVDLVIGSRFLGTFEPGAITHSNRAGTRALTAVLNTLYRTEVTDPIAGFRLVRASALRGLELRAVRYDIEVDLLLALLNAGRRVVEVGVRRMPRAAGSTSLSPVTDGTRILAMILRRWFERVTTPPPRRS